MIFRFLLYIIPTLSHDAAAANETENLQLCSPTELEEYSALLAVDAVFSYYCSWGKIPLDMGLNDMPFLRIYNIVCHISHICMLEEV